MSDYIESKKGIVNILRQIVDDDLETNQKFTEVFKKYGDFLGVFVGYENGKTIKDDKNIPNGYDPRKRPWYIEAQKANALVLSDPYIDAFTSKPCVTFSVPLRAENALKGVLAFDTSLDNIKSMLNREEDAKNYYILVDTNGLILVHPKAKKDVGKHLKQTPIKGIAKLIKSKDHGIFTYDYKGQHKIIAFSRVKGTKMVALFSSSINSFLEKNDQNTKSNSIVAVIISLVGLVLLFFILSFLFKPINKLGYMVNDLAEGEGDLTKRLSIASKDEIGEISQDVNKFIEKIQDLILDSKKTSSENASVANELSSTSLGVGKRVEVETKLVNDMVLKGCPNCHK